MGFPSTVAWPAARPPGKASPEIRALSLDDFTSPYLGVGSRGQERGGVEGWGGSPFKWGYHLQVPLMHVSVFVAVSHAALYCLLLVVWWCDVGGALLMTTAT